MEQLLAQSWRRFQSEVDLEKKRQFFKIGYDCAKKIVTDPKLTPEDFSKNDFLLVSNLSWFSQINRLYNQDQDVIPTAPIVGILCRAEIEPTKVFSGQSGAGSEYAAVVLAEVLAKRGYNVIVFCNFKLGVDWRRTLPCSNPQYLPISRNDETAFSGFTCPGTIISFSSLLHFDPTSKPLDHLILWRDLGHPHYKYSNYSNNLYLWCHDFFEGHLDYEPKAIYVLTEFHKKHAISKLGQNHNYVVGCNGTSINLNPEVLTNPERDFYKCIYASNYSRGLEDLIEIWPYIKKRFPQATLDIYYGRETYGTMTSEAMINLCNRIEDLKVKGVTEKGKVPHFELYQAMSQAGFLLFPYKGYSETFSIVSVAAQQTGCIPVVKRDHGLLETVFQDTSKELRTNLEFSNRIVELMKLGRNSEKIAKLRKDCYDHAIRYTWDAAADFWEEAFKSK